VRLGVELVGPLAIRRPDLAPVAVWREAAVAAEEAGFTSVWLTAAGNLDPCTLAGAVAVVTSSITVGVVAALGPGDRNPSVLAREVTAIDVLSSGRAALLLQGDPEPVTEAATVCRLLWAGDVVDFEGAAFHLRGAVNRPPPVGEPGVLVQSSEPPPITAVDGWVVDGGPSVVASWRAAIGTAPLYWRGALGGDPAAGAAALARAGVDGLIVQVPASADEVVRVGRALA
jgi:hypothetical protein